MYNNTRSKQIIERDYTRWSHQSWPSNRFQIPRNSMLQEYLLNWDAKDSFNINNLTATNVTWGTDWAIGYQWWYAILNWTSAKIDWTIATQSANVNIYTSLWIRRTWTWSAANNCIMQFQETSTNIRFWFWITSWNVLSLWNSWAGQVTSAITPTLNTWEHYVFWRDWTNVYIYKNWILVYSVANSSNDWASVVKYARIWARENSLEFFKWDMCLVKPHYKILNNKEIQTLYKEWLKLLH
jgi:hypothetical protein